MTTKHQVFCIKPDSSDPDNRIDGIGGVNRDGSRWYLPEDRAIAGIESRTWEFFVEVNRREVRVIVATRNNRKYLRTEPDGYTPNNLLKLPTCPP